VCKRLGSGAFGEIFKGMFTGLAYEIQSILEADIACLIIVLYAASIVFVLADINSFMLIIVEKIRTGEFFAAKIVSALFIIQKTWVYN
jgi:hypothetical protein